MKDNEIEYHLLELSKWEKDFFLTNTTEWKTSYYEVYEKVIDRLDERRKKKLFKKLDDILFRLQSSYAQSRSYEEWSHRVIQTARLFDSRIIDGKELRDLSLDKCNFLAEQYMAQQRLLSFSQGSVTGLGGFLFLAADLPALAFIQLQSLQKLAFIYGYDPRHPDEIMNTLKLLHIATVPKQFQRLFWDELCETVLHSNNEERNTVFQQSSTEWFLQQIGKSFLITMLRKKVFQGIPVLGIGVGAGMNYRFSQHVIEIGQQFYKKRRLLEE